MLPWHDDCFLEYSFLKLKYGGRMANTTIKPKTGSKIVNPVGAESSVISAIQVLQKAGYNIDSIKTQIVDDAIDRIEAGEDLIDGLDDATQTNSVEQCCPGLG